MLQLAFFFNIYLFLTAYRDKKNTPSGFTLKLRKHIRTRRLEDVRQLGYDRVSLLLFFLLLWEFICFLSSLIFLFLFDDL